MLLCLFGRLRWWPRVIPTTIPASILKEELKPVMSTANTSKSISPWGNVQVGLGFFAIVADLNLANLWLKVDFDVTRRGPWQGLRHHGPRLARGNGRWSCMCVISSCDKVPFDRRGRLLAEGFLKTRAKTCGVTRVVYSCELSSSAGRSDATPYLINLDMLCICVICLFMLCGMDGDLVVCQV